MAKSVISANQEAIKTVSSLDELDALLEDYKKSNPAKYAIKEKNGEFEKLRTELGAKKSK